MLRHIVLSRCFFITVSVAYVLIVLLPAVFTVGQSIYIMGNPLEFDIFTNNHLTVFLNLILYLIPLVFGYFGSEYASNLSKVKPMVFTRINRRKTLFSNALSVYLIAFLLTFMLFGISYLTLYCNYDHSSTFAEVARLLSGSRGINSEYEYVGLFVDSPISYYCLWSLFVSIYAASCSVCGFVLSWRKPNGIMNAVFLFASSLILMLLLTWIPGGLSVYSPQSLFNPRGLISRYQLVKDLKWAARLIYFLAPLVLLTLVGVMKDE